MTNSLEAIRVWLQTSYGVQAPQDWLTVCVEWIQEENGGQEMSAAQLQPLVFEQWLMADLRELGAGCLPDNVTAQSTMVTGPLALQVESMLDVGFPLYGQLQKVKGTVNTNSEVSADQPQQPAWEPKASRMMMMKMTDGQTDIQGMEYKPIQALHDGLQPGFKVAVHGEVQCRRGVLMLTGDNLQVLGGEVDSLVEANPPVAVLERAMEMNSANNGKHEKMQFSGRFINKQDYSCGGQKGCKEATSAQQSSYSCGKNNLAGQSGKSWTSSVTIKKQPKTMDDELQEFTSQELKQLRSAHYAAVQSRKQAAEVNKQEAAEHNDKQNLWEEDLDYGGILNTLDEPMEEKISVAQTASASHHFSSNPAFQPVGQTVPRNVSRPAHQKAPLSVVKFQHSRAASTSGSKTPMGGKSNLKEEFMDDFDEAVLFDDDDEVFGNTDTHYTRHSRSGEAAGMTVAQPRKSFQVNRPTEVDDQMWDDNDDFALIQAEAEAASPVYQPQISSISSSNMYSHNTLNYDGNKEPNLTETVAKQMSRDAKPPPPAKQHRLTSMLSTVKTEPSSQTTNGCSLSGPLPSVPVSCEVIIKYKAESVTEKLVRGDDASGKGNTNLSSRLTVAVPAEQMETSVCENAERMGLRNENIHQTVRAPFSSSQESRCQLLKDIQNHLQSNCDNSNSNTFTINGYITTLTDRLRSGKGDAWSWSLLCRISDGSATVEVAISDKVLSDLIGFTAERSIILRQEARQDPKVKDFLSESLQKCQNTLKDFTGLIELQTLADSNKLAIVNMTQFGTKHR